MKRIVSPGRSCAASSRSASRTTASDRVAAGHRRVRPEQDRPAVRRHLHRAGQHRLARQFAGADPRRAAARPGAARCGPTRAAPSSLWTSGRPTRPAANQSSRGPGTTRRTCRGRERGAPPRRQRPPATAAPIGSRSPGPRRRGPSPLSVSVDREPEHRRRRRCRRGRRGSVRRPCRGVPSTISAPAGRVTAAPPSMPPGQAAPVTATVAASCTPHAQPAEGHLDERRAGLVADQAVRERAADARSKAPERATPSAA